METFSALLAICVGNSPVTGEFPTQRPVTRSFDVLFDLHPNKRWSKQSGWWFETPSCPLWGHCNGISNHQQKWNSTAHVTPGSNETNLHAGADYQHQDSPSRYNKSKTVPHLSYLYGINMTDNIYHNVQNVIYKMQQTIPGIATSLGPVSRIILIQLACL